MQPGQGDNVIKPDLGEKPCIFRFFLLEALRFQWAQAVDWRSGAVRKKR